MKRVIEEVEASSIEELNNKISGLDIHHDNYGKAIAITRDGEDDYLAFIQYMTDK